MTSAETETRRSPNRPIVVGVSVSTGSKAALQWAVEEAQARQSRVRAVMAWRPAGLPGGAPGRPPAQAITSVNQRQIAQDRLAEAVADALGQDHDVECRAVQGSPRPVLLHEAEDASLLVLDSPRLAKLTNPAARRLAPRLLFDSPCPVVVMPPPTHPEAAAERDLERDESAERAEAAISG